MWTANWDQIPLYTQEKKNKTKFIKLTNEIEIETNVYTKRDVTE